MSKTQISGSAPAVCLVGAQPPPLHGVSVVNEAMLANFQKRSVAVTSIDNASKVLRISWLSRFNRLLRYAKASGQVLAFCLKNAGGCIYLSVGGGYGMLYDALLLGTSRLAGMQLVVHHHSFHYVDHDFWPAQLFFTLCGPKAQHVVLSQGMANCLRERYPNAQIFHVMSNAAVVGVPQPASRKDGQKRIGLLANLSREKGLDDFLELATRGQHLGVSWVLAGPIMDPSDEMRCRVAMAKINNIEWIGPVYGAEKARFWRSLDAFVFPTRYLNEAEPLVVLEAMRLGIPVIAYGRGCIPEMLGDSGACVPVGDDFTSVALAVIPVWLDGGSKAAEQKDRTVAQYQRLYESSSVSLEHLLDSILNDSQNGRSTA